MNDPGDSAPASTAGEDRDLRERLEELERRYRELRYYLPDALVEVDLHSRKIVFMNRMGQVLFGYSQEEIDESPPSSILFAEGEFERAVEVTSGYAAASFFRRVPYERTGAQELLEFEMRRKDGSTFTAETQTSFILDADRVPEQMRTLIRDVSLRKRAEAEREKMIVELREAVAQVKKLQGLLPICASCRKVRDDSGYWNRLEAYVGEHSQIEFSHGICPDCMKKMYPR